MKKLGVLAAATVMIFGAQLLAAAGARAEIEYPYCHEVNGGYGSGFVSCGFTTMAQCRETVLGMGGWCLANPYYVAGRAPATEERPRRGSRRQPGS
jgi:Protein of unknown function (DUF3551)